MEIFNKPLTDEERKEHTLNIRKMPVRYHLIDCLKDLKFGRPASNQHLLDKWIAELKDLDEGKPF
jgi:hypothetical protein